MLPSTFATVAVPGLHRVSLRSTITPVSAILHKCWASGIASREADFVAVNGRIGQETDDSRAFLAIVRAVDAAIDEMVVLDPRAAQRCADRHACACQIDARPARVDERIAAAVAAEVLQPDSHFAVINEGVADDVAV